MQLSSLPLQNLQTWSYFNSVRLFDATIESLVVGNDGIAKGGGLLASGEHGPGQPFIAVPTELVLSKERVEHCAKADRQFKGADRGCVFPLPGRCEHIFLPRPPGRQFHSRLIRNFNIQTPRTAVLLFLVYQMTIDSPGCQGHRLGSNNPFADYVKMLPHEFTLPTFYTTEEKELLTGTSLADALHQKVISLEREFEVLKDATTSIPWCQKFWWDDTTNCLNSDDWKIADAMYRSRALELPRGGGVGMVPVIDMANHASDELYNARFEVDEASETVLLVVRDNEVVKNGDEITINYGSGGACEMIFSYGFLEEHASSAREIFLTLSIPSDDPLRMAKIHFAQEAPGVRIYEDDSNQIRWESTFVWWTCVNEEDGLDFVVERTLDGDTELQAQWKGNELIPEALQAVLSEDPLREVFALRAVVRIQERVEQQGMLLAASEDDYDHTPPSDQIRSSVYKTVGRLREYELELVTRAYEKLEIEKAALLESSVVCRYLEDRQNPLDATHEIPEDFS